MFSKYVMIGSKYFVSSVDMNTDGSIGDVHYGISHKATMLMTHADALAVKEWVDSRWEGIKQATIYTDDSQEA